MSIHPYISFNGNCREAVSFYADVFEADPPQILTFSSMTANPDYPLPDAYKDQVLHTQLQIMGQTVMFSDTFPGAPYQAGSHISLAVVGDDREQLQRLFRQLEEGGQVDLELQATDWSECYGLLTDKFGTRWQFNLSHASQL